MQLPRVNLAPIVIDKHCNHGNNTTFTLFWRLFSLIRKMDKNGQIAPQNYSTVLGGMITAFILVFLTAVFMAMRG